MIQKKWYNNEILIGYYEDTYKIIIEDFLRENAIIETFVYSKKLTEIYF